MRCAHVCDGLCIVGDSAGFLNGLRLKGIHLAMKSGMLAAEAIFDALQAGDTSARALGAYETRFRDSWAFESCTRRGTSTRVSAAACGAVW